MAAPVGLPEVIKSSVDFAAQVLGLLFPNADEERKKWINKLNKRLFEIAREMDEILAKYPRHDGRKMVALIKEKTDIENSIISTARIERGQ